jgi:Flp pilus assembly protein TadG
MSRSGPHWRSSQKGSALVEAAITLPVLIVLLIGTIDFARVFYLAIELTNAARAGAQFGAKDRGSSVDDDATAAAARASVTTTGISAEASHVCECALADGSFPNTVDCTDDPAAACPSPKFRVITVTVTTSKLFSIISGYPGIFTRSFTVSRSAVMRVTE